jgi:hypothetical protein
MPHNDLVFYGSSDAGMKEFDRILLEAVEAGIESGRSIGVLEAYNFLIREGFDAAAEILMILVDEETETRKIKGDA